MSLSQIFEGWKNHLSPDAYLVEQINTASEQRMAICRKCPHFSKNNANANPFRFDEHCTNCGCTLSAKTKCLSCSCPLAYWPAIITSEEEQIIEKHEKKL
jgi:hypothetical protein